MSIKIESDKGKNDDDDDEDAEEQYSLVTTKEVHHKYDVYLSTSFDSPESYWKLYQLLDKAKATDSVTFYLNSYGGRVDAGIQFISKLKNTKAKTKTIVEAPSYSMGAIFPFLTDSFEMRPHTFLMFHDASGFKMGKMNEMELSVTTFNSLFKDILKKHCSSVLTAKEITSITHGRDLYLTDVEVNERLKKGKKK